MQASLPFSCAPQEATATVIHKQIARDASRVSSLKPHCVSSTPFTQREATRPKTRPMIWRYHGRCAKTAAREPTAMDLPEQRSADSSCCNRRKGVAPSASMSSTRSPRDAAAPATCTQQRRDSR
eukprot:6194153-Pleurochrysis_carterae.AAC.8